MKKLTIAITTFNREKELIEQLKSIEKQGLYDKYEVVISDNCSNYDVEDSINNNFSEDFISIIKVHHNKYNIGADCNIARTFELVDTEWMWLLSDDDITEPGSIEKILKDIDTYREMCAIKYSIAGGFCPYEDRIVESLLDFFTLFNSKEHKFTEMIFMSNIVYNLPSLEPYLGSAQDYKHTCYSQLIPIFHSLIENKAPLLLSSYPIVFFVDGRRSYSAIIPYLNFCNILYSKFPLSNLEADFLTKMRERTNSYISLLIRIENQQVRHRYFKKLLIDYYSILSLPGLMFIVKYYICSLFRSFVLKRINRES